MIDVCNVTIQVIKSLFNDMNCVPMLSITTNRTIKYYKTKPLITHFVKKHEFG